MGSRERRAWIEQVLAIVENKQQFSIADVSHQRFQHRARLFQSCFIPADVINELAIFRRDFASSERRLEKPRAAPIRAAVARTMRRVPGSR